MNKIVLAILISICSIQMSLSQDQDGVVSLALPIRNSLTFNQYAINPTFSFVRQQNKSISITNKREWVQFEDAPQTYLASFSGRFSEYSGLGIGLFQQNYGVLTTFGGIVNFAYNARLARDSNLTFGLNVGAYKSGINSANVVTNFADPSLENIPSNFLLTINPGINYGTGFMDFGLSINNLALFNTSELIEDNPGQIVQGHIMYTGYLNMTGFFDESKFSGLVRSEFRKDKTVVSGLAMLTVPKGIWAQVGYNNLYGASGGLGINITKQIAIEYNFEKALGDLTDFGPSHEITLAYRFKNNERYDYSREDEVSSIFVGDGKKPVNNVNAEENRERAIEAKAEAKLLAEAKEQADAEAKAEAEQVKLVEAAKAKEQAEAKAKLDAEAKLKADAQAKIDAEAAKAASEAQAKEVAEAKAKIAAENKVKADAKAKADAEAAKIAEAAKLKAEAAQAKLAAENKAKADAKAKAEAEIARLAEEAVLKAEAAQAKLVEENKIKAEAKAKEVAEAVRIAEETRIETERLAQIELEAKNKAKTDAAKAEAEANKLAEEAVLKAEAKAQKDAETARITQEVKIETERLAQIELEAKNKAKAEAKAKADAETARVAEETRIETERLAQIELEAKNKAKADAKAKTDAETERIAEETRIETERLAQIELIAKNKAKAEAKAIEDAEALKLAEEAKANAEVLQAQLAEAARIKAEADAQAKLEAEAKAKQDLIANPTDDIAKTMSSVEKMTEDAKSEQSELLTKLTEAIENKNKDLKDLKEENDLSDQGIVMAPKPFKSVTAENALLEGLKLDLDKIIETRNQSIKELEDLYEKRLKIYPLVNDEVNLYYQSAIKKLKAEQMKAMQTKTTLASNLENIKEATEFERKRRIKRAAFDSEQDRFVQDRAALSIIKQNTKLSSTPLKEEDFDFGEEQSNNIQILKNVKNVNNGYYVVVAVHNDIAKRDEFVRNVVASGRNDIDFFYDVNTSKYYIYYDSFSSIEEANEAMKSKGDRPYNGKMSLVKIEN